MCGGGVSGYRGSGKVYTQLSAIAKSIEYCRAGDRTFLTFFVA